jgi:hypothetical protein
MTLKVENIYKGINLYIFIALITLLIYIKKPLKLKKFIIDKYINNVLLLFISVTIWYNLKLGILLSVIYINLII